MPGPPPPPPPGGPPPMMPPPPVAFGGGGGKGGADNRSALLSSIRKGAALKKTVTNDRSAPITGKGDSSSSSNSSSGVGGSPQRPAGNGHVGGGGVPNGLGGLFAGGMPKLRSTGKNLSDGPNNSAKTAPAPETPPPKSATSIQDELKKQLSNGSRNMNRGPPPPAPLRSYNNSEDASSPAYASRNGSSNGYHQNVSTPNLTALNPPAPYVQHRKSNSNVNVSSGDATDNNNGGHKNFGKPNLAPKPPVNGKPVAPPKKLIINGKPVTRAQSMRSPRSPSPQSPENNNSDLQNKFGTVRNFSAVQQQLQQNLGQSMGNLNQNKSRPSLNSRPSGLGPVKPEIPPPPPPSKTAVKPPSHAPPPPPTSWNSSNQSIPQAPSQAPPAPPHRTTPSRAPPSVPPVPPSSSAPPPPPRHSSIREQANRKPSSAGTTVSCDLEKRFNFRPSTDFPPPMMFSNVPKLYTSRQVGSSKQQAPLPPNQLERTRQHWEASTC